MSVGLFGGSFDPVHFGHLTLAVDMIEKTALDEVWFCPAFISPFKQRSSPVSGEHRLNMLRLALEGVSAFSIVDYELQHDSPSYTVNTLKYLVGKHPEKRFHLILTDETASSFSSWYRPEEVLQLAPPYIGRRLQRPFRNALFDDSLYVKTAVVEISSTTVRERLAAQKYVGHMVPAKVIDYILRHRLYSSFSNQT